MVKVQASKDRRVQETKSNNNSGSVDTSKKVENNADTGKTGSATGSENTDTSKKDTQVSYEIFNKNVSYIDRWFQGILFALFGFPICFLGQRFWFIMSYPFSV